MVMLIFIALQIAIVVGLTMVERRRNPAATDWLRNLQAWVLDVGTGFMLVPLAHEWAPFSLFDYRALPFAVACAILVFARDGLEFAFHVCQHRVPFMWRMHSLHHSDPEMSALTTGRHFWGDKLIKVLTVWPMTTLIIGSTYEMATVYSIISLYNYFIHANLKVNLGKWSWVINAPAYHRRHHSRLPEHYNSNYAALFPIFDVIFRTYNRPEGWPPTGQARMPKRVVDLLIWPFLKLDMITETAGEAEAPPVELETAPALRAAA